MDPSYGDGLYEDDDMTSGLPTSLPKPRNCSASIGNKLIVMLCYVENSSILVMDTLEYFLRTARGMRAGNGINNQYKFDGEVQFFD